MVGETVNERSKLPRSEFGLVGTTAIEMAALSEKPTPVIIQQKLVHKPFL